MTAKRFEVYKVIGSFHEWSIEDNLNDKVVFGCIMHKYEADRLCELLNELHEENENLKDVNVQCCNDYSAMRRDVLRYKEENEQLKFQLDECQNHKLFSRRELEKENEQLKKDVEYWKQVASQYNNELNVFEHCKKYKTECKDIHWSSD